MDSGCESGRLVDAWYRCWSETYVCANCKDTLPSGDWVRADDWMYRLQRVAGIFGVATRVSVHLEV
jgi:hypothetical protein